MSEKGIQYGKMSFSAFFVNIFFSFLGCMHGYLDGTLTASTHVPVNESSRKIVTMLVIISQPPRLYEVIL